MDYTVEYHLNRKADVVREIYDLIMAAARQFGDVVEDPKKTSIHLVRKSAFAGISMQRNSLVLTLKSKVEITDRRVRRSEPLSAQRWHNEIKITSPDELDQVVLGWLKDSYEISE